MITTILILLAIIFGIALISILYLLLKIQSQIIKLEDKLLGQQIGIVKLLNDICIVANSINDHLCLINKNTSAKKYKPRKFV